MIMIKLFSRVKFALVPVNLVDLKGSCSSGNEELTLNFVVLSNIKPQNIELFSLMETNNVILRVYTISYSFCSKIPMELAFEFRHKK